MSITAFTVEACAEDVVVSDVAEKIAITAPANSTNREHFAIDACLPEICKLLKVKADRVSEQTTFGMPRICYSANSEIK